MLEEWQREKKTLHSPVHSPTTSCYGQGQGWEPGTFSGFPTEKTQWSIYFACFIVTSASWHAHQQNIGDPSSHLNQATLMWDVAIPSMKNHCTKQLPLYTVLKELKPQYRVQRSRTWSSFSLLYLLVFEGTEPWLAPQVCYFTNLRTGKSSSGRVYS